MNLRQTVLSTDAEYNLYFGSVHCFIDIISYLLSMTRTMAIPTIRIKVSGPFVETSCIF